MCTIFASAPCMCDGTIFNFTHSIYTLLCCFFKMADGLCHTIGIGYDKMKCGWRWGRVESMYCTIWGLFPSTSERFLLAMRGRKTGGKSSSLWQYLYFMYGFSSSHTAQFGVPSAKRTFLAFNFRVDMLDLASHSSLPSHLIPFVLCLYVYGSPNLLLFCSFNLAVYINELCSSLDRASRIRCLGWRWRMRLPDRSTQLKKGLYNDYVTSMLLKKVLMIIWYYEVFWWYVSSVRSSPQDVTST